MSMKETLIWLSGLISTDGSVGKTNSKCPDAVYLNVTSVEDDWLEVMKKQLNIIGIETSISHSKKHAQSLYIHNASYVITLLVDNNCQEWFNPRKWKKVMAAYQFYNSPDYIPRKRWTKEEERLLIEGNIEELEKTREHQPIINKRAYMKRTKDAIRKKMYRLSIKNECPRRLECKMKAKELAKSKVQP